MAPGRVNTGSGVQVQASPLRASPRKSSSTYASRPLLPTPLSMSPTKHTSSSFSTNRYPPSFQDLHSSSRYSAASNTPYSPYRPGEYGRSERGLASERTKIERKLFDEEGDRDELLVPPPKEENRGSSPLAPAFEAKMVLRNGASVDLISWLRTNFHYTPPAQQNILTPCMSLIQIRALLLERFPRVPEPDELAKTVTAAFPHSHWDYPNGTSFGAEPPNVRGLKWHGRDIDDEEEPVEEKPPRPSVLTRARASLGSTRSKVASGSRSPTQSTLVSPTSSSARRHLPNTPARSVLEEFAEIATLAEQTPTSKPRSLPGELVAPAPAYTLANICNSFGNNSESRKRRASDSPDASMRRRDASPDRLQGLLAAAEAVEGSLSGMLGHKRRRTIGGMSGMRHATRPSRKAMSSRATISPAFGSGLSLLPELAEHRHVDMLVPLNDTAASPTEQANALSHERDLETASMATPHISRGHTSSTASQTSSISNILPVATPTPNSRKPNELPTQGANPGVDCKPPHPYHEMIRHAIENAPDQRLQLSQIYTSIAERFPFFKTLDEKKTAGWQNSIRHNLSLKKMFVRVNKLDGVPDDAGSKGGWWTVQPGVPDEGRPGRKSKGKKKGDYEIDGDEDSVEPAGSIEGFENTVDGSSHDSGNADKAQQIGRMAIEALVEAGWEGR
ncbi:hypothetical protein BCR39DRAFT_562358 [Naematelia encephala]|uniref:Fork-head domain-containing protein n=1 Tax=Naematelia encephala TaxID=71784 RepID=A0A1Y2AKB7_9TREE|nr:hypothetical protein BCR39DRAFT_562358 [Naematelia encephala]